MSDAKPWTPIDEVRNKALGWAIAEHMEGQADGDGGDAREKARANTAEKREAFNTALAALEPAPVAGEAGTVPLRPTPDADDREAWARLAKELEGKADATSKALAKLAEARRLTPSLLNEIVYGLNTARNLEVALLDRIAALSRPTEPTLIHRITTEIHSEAEARKVEEAARNVREALARERQDAEGAGTIASREDSYVTTLAAHPARVAAEPTPAGVTRDGWLVKMRPDDVGVISLHAEPPQHCTGDASVERVTVTLFAPSSTPGTGEAK